MDANIITSTDLINFVEICVVKPQSSPNVIDSTMRKELFLDILKQVAKQYKLKYSSKQIKRYKKNNLVLEISNNEYKTYKETVCNFSNEENLFYLYKKRDRIPYHLFPCTTDFNEIVYIKRLIFRLHNRLFLNFEILRNMENEELFKIYINYNHDKTSEINSILELLNNIIEFLKKRCDNL